MTAKNRKSGSKRQLTEFKVRLVPHFDSNADAIRRQDSVQKIIGIMFTELRKRGRPKNDKEEISDVA